VKFTFYAVIFPCLFLEGTLKQRVLKVGVSREQASEFSKMLGDFMQEKLATKKANSPEFKGISLSTF
jgi:hypothetical protein